MIYISAAALLTLLAACNNDDMENTSYQSDPLAVRINATAGKNVITRSNPTNDDATQTEFNEEDRISISAEGQSAVTYKKTATGWEAVGGYLKWTKTPLNFQAYYPIVDNASMTTFTVPTQQNEEGVIENADYMTFDGPLTKPATADGTVTLTLERKMARVVISSIQFNDQFNTADYSVTGITVHSNTSGYEDGAPKTGNIDVEAYKADGKFYALLSPATQDDAEKFLTVTVKANDADENASGTELVVKGIPELEAGNSYSYTLVVGKNEIYVSSVTVKDWNTGAIIGEEENETDEQPTVNATTHTIKTTAEGQIADEANSGWMAEAIGTGTSLTVTGPMNEADLTAIATYLKSLSGTTIDLDLSDAGLTSIPGSAFCVSIYPEEKGTESLGSVSLPRTLTSIGDFAFWCCPSIEITNWNELTSLKTIGTRAFQGSSLNGNITVPEGVETIGEYAFYKTSIESITLPSTLHSIAGNLFCNCSSLAEIVCKGDIETVGNGAFGYCGALVEIDLSACTDVPSCGIAGPDYIFNNLGLAGDTNPGGITLWVNADLVDTFKAASPWNKCKVTAATE